MWPHVPESKTAPVETLFSPEAVAASWLGSSRSLSRLTSSRLGILTEKWGWWGLQTPGVLQARGTSLSKRVTPALGTVVKATLSGYRTCWPQGRHHHGPSWLRTCIGSSSSGAL